MTCYNCAYEVTDCAVLENGHEDYDFFDHSLDFGDIWDFYFCFGSGAFHFLILRDQFANGIHEQNDQALHIHNTSYLNLHDGHDHGCC